MYQVKEIFSTLQGEGANTGRVAVFLRFSGCNLWSGREEDRATAVCQFCDTDFFRTNGTEGGKYPTAERLAAVVARLWSGPSLDHRFVVCTGGEPLLQLDEALIDALHERGFTIAVETNGTLAVPWSIDWVCVSPKSGAALVQKNGDELKLVYPQDGGDPAQFAALRFAHFFLQPMDGPHVREHTQQAVAYCLTHPQWRLSLQTHKMIGLP